jgi:YD repeat-containing protein
VTSGAGDGSLTATSAFTWDTVGNRLTVDGPLPGTADTTRTRYDADREVVGVVDPDPDGAGALKNRAVRISYNADGQVTKTELGTVLSQSDADWANFVTAQQVDTTYDANARATQQKLVSGTTTYALTQANYDSMGRVNCSAVRMNPAIYGSLPSDACALGTTGSYGPDRISQVVYDADSRPTQLKVAVGTSDAATERTLTWSDNGKVTSLTDGENNKTTYVYDGFDRLSQTQYPNTTKGSGTSNASDYEQLTYDANSNVTALRVRDGSSITYDYDNLNRPTAKHRPAPNEFDVTFAYDNLDRLSGANTWGYAANFYYDALGRKTAEMGIMGRR